jgi:hypothetical protein
VIGWLKRLWRRPVARPEPRPATFRYHDGTKFQERDPWELVTDYNRAGELIMAINSDFWSGDPSAKREALEEVAAIVRSIFDIPAFTDGGLPTMDVLELSARFAEFIAADRAARLEALGVR